MFTPISFIVTVVLFGSEHTLWLAGMMAGAIYNLLLIQDTPPLAMHTGA